MTREEFLQAIADLCKQWDADNLDQLSNCDVGFTDDNDYIFTGNKMVQE